MSEVGSGGGFGCAPGAGVTRRRFLVAFPVALAGLAGLGVEGLRGAGQAVEHPEPRPGIDGSSVLTAEELADTPHVIELYDRIRRIPHVVDGIRCHCGCADLPGKRSLLSCYEADGMARFCDICQGEGRLAVRRHREGQSLDRIRRAIDARYGPGAEHR